MVLCSGTCVHIFDYYLYKYVHHILPRLRYTFGRFQNFQVSFGILRDISSPSHLTKFNRRWRRLPFVKRRWEEREFLGGVSFFKMRTSTSKEKMRKNIKSNILLLGNERSKGSWDTGCYLKKLKERWMELSHKFPLVTSWLVFEPPVFLDVLAVSCPGFFLTIMLWTLGLVCSLGNLRCCRWWFSASMLWMKSVSHQRTTRLHMHFNHLEYDLICIEYVRIQYMCVYVCICMCNCMYDILYACNTKSSYIF